MELYEISLRSTLEYSQFRLFLSEILDISTDYIVTNSKYWKRIGVDDEFLVGLSILWSDEGFRTFAKWAQPTEMSDITFLKLASEAAIRFGTEVAIGDFTDEAEFSTDKFLVITPDEIVHHAIALYLNNDDFDVEFYGDTKILSQQLQELKNRVGPRQAG